MDIHLLLAIFHIFFVVPLFLYVGFERAATPEWLYSILFGLGVILLVYQGSKGILRYLARSSTAWINIFHVLIVAPLLLWIGYHGKKTERPAYELLLITGFGALGYHLKNLIVLTHTFVKNDD
jgi:hypothetical protein